MSNEQELLKRIERLEKQNGRFRMAGILSLLLICALVTLAQKSKRVKYRTIEAGAIVLKDTSGVTRIKIEPEGIELFDSKGKFAGAVRETVTILNEVKASAYSVFDVKGRDRVRLAMNAERPTIQMIGEEGRVRTAIGQEAIVLLGNSKDEYNTLMWDRMSIRDAGASTATVGATEVVNASSGLHTKTSVATITLFGKDGKVVWQAP